MEENGPGWPGLQRPGQTVRDLAETTPHSPPWGGPGICPGLEPVSLGSASLSSTENPVWEKLGVQSRLVGSWAGPLLGTRIGLNGWESPIWRLAGGRWTRDPLRCPTWCPSPRLGYTPYNPMVSRERDPRGRNGGAVIWLGRGGRGIQTGCAARQVRGAAHAAWGSGERMIQQR